VLEWFGRIAAHHSMPQAIRAKLKLIDRMAG
jgi:hypothetical protein